MLLEQRSPSQNWEPIAFDPSGQQVGWVWYRPPSIPTGLMFSIPPTLFTDARFMAYLSVRQLVARSGLDPNQIACWTVNGLNYDAAAGTSPLLDQPIPASAGGTNQEVSVWMLAGSTPWPGQAPVNPIYPAATSQPIYAFSGSGEDAQLLDAIESCWNGVIALETRVASARKDLAASIARLSSLNRDLSSDERRTCDSRDIQDWQDARRWLRDGISVMSRSVKEIDVGTTSGAGRKHKFEDIYQNHVVPRIPFPGLAQAANEFETYRKILQSVLASATSSLTKATRDAENRANSILQRVGTKMRARRK